MWHPGSLWNEDSDISLGQSFSALPLHGLTSLSGSPTVQSNNIETTKHPSEEWNAKRLFLGKKTDTPCKKRHPFERDRRAFARRGQSVWVPAGLGLYVHFRGNGHQPLLAAFAHHLEPPLNARRRTDGGSIGVFRRIDSSLHID
jgi:hypothetical protein